MSTLNNYNSDAPTRAVPLVHRSSHLYKQTTKDELPAVASKQSLATATGTGSAESSSLGGVDVEASENASATVSDYATVSSSRLTSKQSAMSMRTAGTSGGVVEPFPSMPVPGANVSS